MAKPRTLSTPLVLAIASAMVCVGVVAVLASRPAPVDPHHESAPPDPTHVLVDQSTPERAAESWLDAWRTRSHEDALHLTTGPARDAVQHRMESEQHMSPEDRSIGEAVWKQLADTRLHLEVQESEHMPDGRLGLRCRAVGEWMGRPYERGLSLVMEQRGRDWFVYDYHFDEAEEHGVDPTKLGDDPGALPTRPPPPSDTELGT